MLIYSDIKNKIVNEYFFIELNKKMFADDFEMENAIIHTEKITNTDIIKNLELLFLINESQLTSFYYGIFNENQNTKAQYFCSFDINTRIGNTLLNDLKSKSLYNNLYKIWEEELFNQREIVIKFDTKV